MADDDFETETGGGLLDRIKESPRTVSALIIILIVAAAIYAFSGDDNDQTAEDMDTETAVTEDAAMDEDDADDAEDAEEVAAAATPASTPTEVSQEDLAAETQELPEATTTTEGYTEVAQAGDGITHLARRATTRWLAENQAGYTVTNEHRIYIEDYLQNQIGTDRLALGDARTISYDMIADAVASAGELNDSQLSNLTQYSSALN